MPDHEEILRSTQSIVALMDEKLGIKARTLEKATQRAGRLLPSAARANAALLVEAERMVANPKLARLLDQQAFDAAYRDLLTYLNAVDTAEQRKTRALNMLARLAFNILLFIAVLTGFLWWRGLV